MTAFLRGAAAFAEGKPGNAVCNYFREPDRDTASKTVPGPILLLGAPGVGKGLRPKSWSSRGRFPRFRPETCCARTWTQGPQLASWPGSQCSGGSWFPTTWLTTWWPGGCRSRIPHGATFWTGIRGHWARPTGSTGIWQPKGEPCPWLLSASMWAIISYCVGLRAAESALSARPYITSTQTHPSGPVFVM